jgi:hypothetical protein
MKDEGMVGEDDGVSAWRKTFIDVLVAGKVVHANLLRDGYSGKRTLRVVRDEIGMEPATAKVLLLAVYDVSSTAMVEFSCEIGEAFLDLEAAIRDLFYRAQAEDLIRRITAAG